MYFRPEGTLPACPVHLTRSRVCVLCCNGRQHTATPPQLICTPTVRPIPGPTRTWHILTVNNGQSITSPSAYSTARTHTHTHTHTHTQSVTTQYTKCPSKPTLKRASICNTCCNFLGRSCHLIHCGYTCYWSQLYTYYGPSVHIFKQNFIICTSTKFHSPICN